MSIRRRDTKKGTRYDVRLRGPDGREASGTFRTEREARLFEAEQRTMLQQGGRIDPRSASTPLADVAVEWLDSNPSKRPSTLARDDVTLRLHLLPPLGNRPIGQITPAEVHSLVKQWFGERKPSSVVRDYRTLAAIFNYAVEQEFIARSPCRKVKLPKGGQIFLGDPKSDAGRRMLAMPAALASVLAAHLIENELADEAAFVFAAPDGGPLHYANWYHRVWEPAVVSAGLEGLTFHDLRRANATGLVSAGVDVKTAQTRLGHSSSRLTLELYAQSVARLDRDAAEALGVAFMPDWP